MSVTYMKSYLEYVCSCKSIDAEASIANLDDNCSICSKIKNFDYVLCPSNDFCLFHTMMILLRGMPMNNLECIYAGTLIITSWYP